MEASRRDGPPILTVVRIARNRNESTCPKQSSMRVQLEHPSRKREDEFLRAVRRSRELHRNLVTPPSTPERYQKLLKASRKANCAHFFVSLKTSGALVGVINIESIVRGYFHSATLGYYGFVPFAGQGFMREGLVDVLRHAFRRLKLHRLEANIQPRNERSIALVRSLGFRLEGYSPRYLKISGRWRDHERWAILADEWRSA